ncbi:MAG: hypothetical protein IJN71_06530, partial [Oscillospiraceae bacterium]|nr:hypothetical protein [Oscillospiraceae bacterium]
TVFGVWNHKELYRDIMVDFFDKYTDQNYVNDTKKENEQKIMVENIEGLLTKAQGIKDDIGDIKGYVDLVSDIKNLISVANGYVTNIDSIALEYVKIVEKIAVYDPSVNTIRMTTYSMSSTSVSVVTSKSSLKAGKVSGISVALDIAGGAIDIADTWSSFATINANAEAFDKNMDILFELRDYGNRIVAQEAASDIVDALGEGYGDALSNAIGADFGELTANLVITAASANPYVAAVKFVRDTIDILTGLSPTLKREYQMLCYNSMASAVKTLINENTYKYSGYYYMVNDEDVIRYLTNLANIRLFGEDKYLEFYTNGMNSWFTDEEATAEKINTSKNNVYIIAEELGLNV